MRQLKVQCDRTPADPATGKPAQKTLRAVPAGKIVAESTFDCWVNLLDKGG
ncbi:hypothetical protein ACWGJX_43950 [Streptomyces sp. NPDC054775]